MNVRPQKPEFISVIVSIYNSPEWLEKSLWGFAFQEHRDFELLIADDGSDDGTAELLDRMREQTGLTLKHVWQDNDGQRKCTVLNKAVDQAAGDYLLFTEGSCLPRSDFVMQHHRAAQRGRFLSGGNYRLPNALSEQITEDDIRSGNAFSATWLCQRGLPKSHRLIRLTAQGWQAKILNRITTTRPTWNGSNSSGWADDIGNANGFDERMYDGLEDRELGDRLENAGVRGKHIRYQSVSLQLSPQCEQSVKTNTTDSMQIRIETKRLQRTQTPHGIQRAA